MDFTGIQTGGWEFVQAAYGISFVVFAAYLSFLFRRAIAENAL